MHIGKQNPCFEYTMIVDNKVQTINTCREEKDLGVTFDDNLTFGPHIHRVVSKANQMIGIIKRTFTLREKFTFLKLYKAFVRPHLEYGNIIWYPVWKYQSIAIENVQRRATKLLNECQNMSYSERLRYFNLYSLKGRRIRGDLIEAYKIINNIEDLSTNKFFTLCESRLTRNSEGKIFVQSFCTNKRKYNFSIRVVNLWNALPPATKFAKDTNSFKNLLDCHPKFNQLFYEFDE